MLTKFTGVTNTIQTLADRPNQTDGLTPAQLKLKFDQFAIDNKAYLNDIFTVEVDTLDAQNVKLTGNQTIAGIKTFSSSPIVPTPTTAMQASTKKYVDDVGINKSNDLNTHKTSDDHDGRYYTEAEINALLLSKTNLTGNHEGTWQGRTPVESDPGIQAIVNEITTLVHSGLVDIYVNDTSGVDTNDGTILSPVKTITKAIQLCPAIVKGGGYEAISINIAEGTYKESISLVSFPLSMGTRVWFKGTVDGGGIPTVIIDCENIRTFAFQAMNGIRALFQDIKVINIPTNGYGATITNWCEGYFWNFHVLPYVGATGVAGIIGQSNCRIITRKLNIQNCQFGVEVINSCTLTMGYAGDTDIVINSTEANILLQECSTGHVDRVTTTGSQFGIRLVHNSRANINSCTIQNNTVGGIGSQFNAVAFLGTGNAFLGNGKDYLITSGGVKVNMDATTMNPIDAYSVLPTATEEYRGCNVYIAGTTGQPDKTYMCLKDSANAYSWVETSRKNRPSSRAYKSVAQSVGAAAYTKLTFDTEIYDNANNYDTSLSRFVAPEAGFYSVTTAIQWLSQIVGNRTILKIFKNGANYNLLSDSSAGGAVGSACVGSAVMKLALNDYIEIFAYSVNAITTSNDSVTSFLEVIKITE